MQCQLLPVNSKERTAIGDVCQMQARVWVRTRRNLQLELPSAGELLRRMHFLAVTRPGTLVSQRVCWTCWTSRWQLRMTTGTPAVCGARTRKGSREVHMHGSAEARAGPQCPCECGLVVRPSLQHEHPRSIAPLRLSVPIYGVTEISRSM
jgi:hypothetical protein